MFGSAFGVETHVIITWRRSHLWDQMDVATAETSNYINVSPRLDADAVSISRA